MTRVELIAIVAACLYEEDNRHETTVNMEYAVKDAVKLIEAAASEEKRLPTTSYLYSKQSDK